MIIFKSAKALHNQLVGYSKKKSIGFVPTMGALHEGHISLIHRAKQKCDITVCSIFINPTQFNDASDFENYPVTIKEDILKLEEAGTDILFLPSVNEMYPNGLQAKKQYVLGHFENILEGKYRPGHFQGVCQVVDKLLQIIPTSWLFLGQKDYQQCLVLKEMIASEHRNTMVEVGNTYREESGLAMSSRNLRLSHDEKQAAVAMYNCLQYIKNNFTDTSLDELVRFTEATLMKNGFSKVDYVSICNATTLEFLNDESKLQQPAVALIAAFIGEVRLIDNLILSANAARPERAAIFAA